MQSNQHYIKLEIVSLSNKCPENGFVLCAGNTVDKCYVNDDLHYSQSIFIEPPKKIKKQTIFVLKNSVLIQDWKCIRQNFAMALLYLVIKQKYI